MSIYIQTIAHDGLPHNNVEAKAVIRKLTKAQRELLGDLCLNGQGGHPRTLEALERRGLIEGFERVLPGRFPVKIREYRVPIFVHMAWCEFISE